MQKRHGQRLRRQYQSEFIFKANIVDGAIVVPNPMVRVCVRVAGAAGRLIREAIERL